MNRFAVRANREIRERWQNFEAKASGKLGKTKILPESGPCQVWCVNFLFINHNTMWNVYFLHCIFLEILYNKSKQIQHIAHAKQYVVSVFFHIIPDLFLYFFSSASLNVIP